MPVYSPGELRPGQINDPCFFLNWIERFFFLCLDSRSQFRAGNLFFTIGIGYNSLIVFPRIPPMILQVPSVSGVFVCPSNRRTVPNNNSAWWYIIMTFHRLVSSLIGTGGLLWSMNSRFFSSGIYILHDVQLPLFPASFPRLVCRVFLCPDNHWRNRDR